MERRRRRLLVRPEEEENEEVKEVRPPTPGKPKHHTKATANNSIELVPDGKSEDEEEEEGQGAARVVQLHGVSAGMRMSDGGVTAASMCVPVEMNGVPAGPALVDQGANRSVMRLTAYERLGLEDIAPIWKINGYEVKTASNHRIPIIGRFITDITVNGHEFNDNAEVLVVDDKSDKRVDIACDVVVGRHTIAHSGYRLVDTLQARLVDPDDATNYIPCNTCAPMMREDGKTDLRVREAAHVHALECNRGVLPVLKMKIERRHRQLSKQECRRVIEELCRQH
jgi:hypothetical protein